MKTIYSIITLVSVAFLMFLGISLIGQQALTNNNLDSESINILATYDDQLANFESNFTSIRQQTEGVEDYEPDANLLDEYIKEYSEQKDKVNQLKDAVKLFYKLPDILALSIPFVEFEDLTVYRNIVWFLVSITIFTAIFNAIANRKISNN